MPLVRDLMKDPPKLTVRDLMDKLRFVSQEAEVRIGDVSEKSDLHVSVGAVEHRSQCVVLTPGDDDIWKDETLASNIIGETLWPEEEDDVED